MLLKTTNFLHCNQICLQDALKHFRGEFSRILYVDFLCFFFANTPKSLRKSQRYLNSEIPLNVLESSLHLFLKVLGVHEQIGTQILIVGVKSGKFWKGSVKNQVVRCKKPFEKWLRACGSKIDSSKYYLNKWPELFRH